MGDPEVGAQLLGSAMKPPPGGAIVRMYRIGHGDCFLVAFSGASPERPIYVLVDCGYKPGSSKSIDTTATEVVANIREITGGYIDVVIATHEHQDHVNGFTAKNFAEFTFGEAWFAWTEDPEDEFAGQLRAAFHDKLLGLVSAMKGLAKGGEAAPAKRIETLLEFEFGGSDEHPFDAGKAGDPLGAAGACSMNKASMKLVKDLSRGKLRFLRPHAPVFNLPGSSNVRIFTLGPPRDLELLKSMDPQGEEEFKLSLATRSPGGYLAAAARAMECDLEPDSPFVGRSAVPLRDVTVAQKHVQVFLDSFYGFGKVASSRGARDQEVPSDAPWRRIDHDWLLGAEDLAMHLNDQTNNSSLVLAFELGKGGKVLLFAADAQRGNWLSWARGTWKDGDDAVSAKDLLSRVVLFKVGHHASHNGTLQGSVEDSHPNLNWMGRQEYADEFSAMITAVRAWAETQNGWDHPLKAIKDALVKKCSGRVFQTDSDFDAMQPPKGASKNAWGAFKRRAQGTRLYFDLLIEV